MHFEIDICILRMYAIMAAGKNIDEFGKLTAIHQLLNNLVSLLLKSKETIFPLPHNRTIYNITSKSVSKVITLCFVIASV